MSDKCMLCGHKFKKNEDRVSYIGYSDEDEFCTTCSDERHEEIMEKFEKEENE